MMRPFEVVAPGRCGHDHGHGHGHHSYYSRRLRSGSDAAVSDAAVSGVEAVATAVEPPSLAA